MTPIMQLPVDFDVSSLVGEFATYSLPFVALGLLISASVMIINIMNNN